MEYPIVHYPKYAKKYSGSIREVPLKNSTSYRLFIKTPEVHFDKSYHTYEEAVAMMKQKNLEHDLPIKNKIFEHEDCLSVELTRGMWCKFDIEDREIIEAHTWYFHMGYAEARVGESIQRMHNLIMNHDPTDRLSVDHRSRDTLDNRKQNLRIADRRTQAINQNIRINNKTGKTGVFYDDSQHPRWCSTWREDNTVRKKSFSVKKYGNDQAKQLAINHRQLIERTLPQYIEARTW